MAKNTEGRMDGKKEDLLSYRTLLKKRKPDFVRHKWFSLSSLGGRKKKQKWRKPKGRHNKLREKKRGVGRQPSIGFRSPRLVRGMVGGMKPVVVRNLNDLEKINNLAKKSGREIIAFLASVGLKKKIEIARRAVELKLDFANFNPQNLLKEAEKELETRKKVRKEKEEKIKQKIEKARKAKEKKPEAKQEDKSEKEILMPKSGTEEEKDKEKNETR